MYNADDVDELVEQLANSRVSNKHDAILTLCRDSSCQQALHVTTTSSTVHGGQKLPIWRKILGARIFTNTRLISMICVIFDTDRKKEVMDYR